MSQMLNASAKLLEDCYEIITAILNKDFTELKNKKLL